MAFSNRPAGAGISWQLMGKLTSKGGLVPVGKGWLLPVKMEDIQMLIQAVQDSDLVELVWEDNGSRLVLKKAAPGSGSAYPGPGVETAQLTDGDTDKGQEVAHKAAEGLVTIEAPMVGTFYRAPAPDAEPYVEVGSIVEVGQPLCIIEAMKLMNEIESEVSGRIVEILAENAQPVEYGQPLFVIEQI
ncbi:MAG: acetyl-CoA carboxylase biotin carboxyl carrier protein [Firmicutes bacterium]|nr:acetyl-CoA carboxylase biotin carboxyl carrier protein [Bacillota bacterium]